MRIDELHIEKSPGMGSGLPALKLGSGITVVLGPNASGKTTIARSIRALMWPDAEPFDARLKSRWSVGEESFSSELFASQVHWKPALSAPIPPGAASLARFGIRTLLESGDKGDGEVAHRVARELAGGLDFVAAEMEFERKPRLAATSGHAALRREAKRNLLDAQSKAKGLHQKEKELARLDVDIAAATLAAKHKEAAVALADLVRSHQTVRSCESRLEGFAEGLDQLVGDEGQRIKELTKTLEHQRKEFRGLAEETEKLDAEHRALSFKGSAPDAEELEAWIVRLEELVKTEVRIESLVVELAGANQACEAARAHIVVDDSVEDLDRGSLDALAMKLDRLRTAKSKLDVAERATTVWQDWSEGEDAVALRSAVDGIRTWLRTPDGVVGTSAATWISKALLGLAILMLALGAIAFTAELPAGLPPGVLILSGAVMLFLTRAMGTTKTSATNSDADGARAHAQQAVERLNLAPTSWTTEGVASKLLELEARLSAADQSTRAADRVRDAMSALERAKTKQAECKAELLEWAANAGISEDYVELGALLQVKYLIDWRKADEECARLAGQLQAEQDTCQSKLKQAADWLAPFESKLGEDTAAARAALRALETRCSDLQRCDHQLEQVRVRTAGVKTALDKNERELIGIWNRIGVEHGDQAALIHRLEELARWKQERQQLGNAQLELKSSTERFERAGELPLLGSSQPETIELAEVEGWIASLSSEADGLGDLRERAGGIHHALASAKGAHVLEDAVAATYTVDQDIAAERELAIEDALARTLLEEARSRHNSEHAPPILKRAQSYFSRFTHNAFELKLDELDRFVARDTSANEDRSLEELSDGTRIQLLLAARLSALEELELSGPLPICLDEALATSDPKRFSAIASTLFEVADQGRQIIYFTADPSEAIQWQQAARDLNRTEPAILNLAELKGEVNDWDQSPPNADQALALIPDPTGKTPEEYAQLLHVPPPDRFASPSAWHLYLIAFDHLDELATCLSWRIGTVGQWRSAREDNQSPAAIPEEVAVNFDRHAQLVETLMPLWNVGRGRPVTWQDVEDSRAVTPVFADAVRELLREFDEWPVQFVEAVDEIKGFRSNNVDKLRTHLETVGCLTPEEPHAHKELIRLCLATSDAATTLGPVKAGAYLDWIIGLFNDELKVEIPRSTPPIDAEPLSQTE
ncbi:MAG: exonuclease SbcC [Planctomycetota bacterium]